MQVRSDAYKLSAPQTRRPLSPSMAAAGSSLVRLGIWPQLFEALAVLACVCNCALIGVAGHVQTMLPDWSTTHVVLLLVFIEVCAHSLLTYSGTKHVLGTQVF